MQGQNNLHEVYIQAYIGDLETLTLTLKAENEGTVGDIPGSLLDCGL